MRQPPLLGGHGGPNTGIGPSPHVDLCKPSKGGVHVVGRRFARCPGGASPTCRRMLRTKLPNLRPLDRKRQVDCREHFDLGRSGRVELGQGEALANGEPADLAGAPIERL